MASLNRGVAGVGSRRTRTRRVDASLMQAGCVGQSRLCKPAVLAAPPPYIWSVFLKLISPTCLAFTAQASRGRAHEGGKWKLRLPKMWGLICACVYCKMDGQPRVDCGYVPSANGTNLNLRPELTLFCVGFLTSPSSSHQLSSQPCRFCYIYQCSRIHWILLPNHTLTIAALFSLNPYALFAVIVYIHSLTAYTYIT